MADQGHTVQVSVMQKANDVGDMRLQPNLRTQQMRTLTKAGEDSGDNGVTAGLE
jgi:hypothetical protein